MATLKHWTSTTFGDFVYRISFDFVAQLRAKVEDGTISRAEFADRAKISPSRVSQVFNSPENLRLESMVRYAYAAGMKVAVVAYDDSDPDNNNGPVNSELFYECWKRLGSPRDFLDLRRRVPLTFKVIYPATFPSVAPQVGNDKTQRQYVATTHSAATTQRLMVQ